ncbi:MAG: protein arginine kinase [Candidatus Omnitrophota bacterium]
MRDAPRFGGWDRQGKALGKFVSRRQGIDRMASLPKNHLAECGWLKTGDVSNALVVSSRVRLARNIEDYPFSQWASSSDLKRIADEVKESIQSSPQLHELELFDIEELESLDRHFLAERYMISRELVKSGLERYVAIHPRQTASVMINEEDHIRMQVLSAGSNLRQTWERIDSYDDELENRLSYSFSNSLGYLTACPTNVGTGIRCSVMIHLPALVMSRRIEKVLNAVTQMGLTVRGLSGEGSEIVGNLFQVSNQWTLGIGEEETIDKIEKILKHIIEQEQKAESRMMEEKSTSVEDKVWRAYAVLSQARVLSSNEAIELLSLIRLGRSLGILERPSYESINEAIIWMRPAHLQKSVGKSLSAGERDEVRAGQVREWIRNGGERRSAASLGG